MFFKNEAREEKKLWLNYIALMKQLEKKREKLVEVIRTENQLAKAARQKWGIYEMSIDDI